VLLGLVKEPRPPVVTRSGGGPHGGDKPASEGTGQAEACPARPTIECGGQAQLSADHTAMALPRPRTVSGCHARPWDLPRRAQSSAGHWGGQTSWGVVGSTWRDALRRAVIVQKRSCASYRTLADSIRHTQQPTRGQSGACSLIEVKPKEYWRRPLLWLYAAELTVEILLGTYAA